MLEGKHFILAVICIMALCKQVAAEVALDMALDAVDDMYEGCTKDALNNFVLSDLLKEELNNSDVFQEAWRKSQSKCSEMIPGGVKEYTTALHAYVTGGEQFRTALNNAVNTYGTNATIYQDNFHFKSMHFLLMDSIRLLNPGTCKTVYVLTESKFNVQKGSSVRLGRFYTGHSSLKIIKEETDLDDDVILNITTCYFAELGDNICHDEQITLLSPTEEFTVEEMKNVDGDDDTYTLIVLKYSELKSKHNCYIFSRSPADVPSHWLVLTLLASSFFILS